MKISENIEALIDALKILPGVGPKTAKRMALNLLSTNKQGAELISNSINIALDTIRPCQCCGVINDLEICNIVLARQEIMIFYVLLNQLQIYFQSKRQENFLVNILY